MNRILVAVLAAAALSCANYRTGIAVAPADASLRIDAEQVSRFLSAVSQVAEAHELKASEAPPGRGVLAAFHRGSLDLYAYHSAERRELGLNIIQNGAWSQSEAAQQLERDLGKRLLAEFPGGRLVFGQNRDVLPFAP